MHIESEATQHLQRAAAAARVASHVLARTPDAERNAALRAMAASLRSRSSEILPPMQPISPRALEPLRSAIALP